MNLTEQLELSRRIYEQGKTRGYKHGHALGYQKGLLEGLQEAILAYSTMTPEEFAAWVGEARDVIAVEREHQL